VLELIGNTPLIEIEKDIFAKCEFFNPGGSVKDRIALEMIKEALKKNKNLKTVVEPTSGNTGIALSMIGAILNLKVIIVMPKSMSIERRKLISFFGAKVVLVEGGMEEAIQKAKEIAKEERGIMLDQFSNPANVKAHMKTTAQEILQQFKPDIFVTGVGTGGTLIGVAKVLKPLGTKIVALEPSKSAVLSGGKPSSHKIQGIGAGFIPPLIDFSLIDEILRVEDEDAISTSKELAKTKGLMVGISSGANVWGARELKKRYPNKQIVTMLCDTGERYLSTELFE